MKLKKNICLVAIDIRSTHNVGSFFRTCDGFGSDLCLVGITPRPKYTGDDRLPHLIESAEKSISKTALGAEKIVNWQYYPSSAECIEKLKNEGYKVIALEQNKRSKDLSKMKYKGKIALLVGREVEGLTEGELKLCDEVYQIPMSGIKESFNVSVTAGIGLYQAQLNKL